MIVTLDSPGWYYRIFMGNAGFTAMKKGILEFCGISPVKITSLNMIKSSSEKQRLNWIQQVEKLGEGLK
jgi:NAD(P)H dehydrogenase (quinone)